MKRVEVDLPCRYTASKSRERERRFFRCTRSARSYARTARPDLGRQALTPLRAATLEDHPSCTRRHPRAEAVLALPAAYVWLVGPLHVNGKGGVTGISGDRPASIDRPLRQELSTGLATGKSRGNGG